VTRFVRYLSFALVYQAASMATPACATLVAPLAAQAALPADTARIVVGVVKDSLNGAPLPGALVMLIQQDRGVLTDSVGRFVLPAVPDGPFLLSVGQYGYETRMLVLDGARDDTRLREVTLHPSPAAIEGLAVVADNIAEMDRRLGARRNAYPLAVRTAERDLLLHTSARDLHAFISTQLGVPVKRCPSLSSRYYWCVVRRGRYVTPRVFVDEVPNLGGLDSLENYGPHNFYLVEVYAGGLEIRAYTHQFMDHAARRPMPLLPIAWQ
jgi:hypothetical protein